MSTSQNRCSDCGNPYKSRRILNRHVRLKHQPQVTTHVCSECRKEFARKDYLVRHQKDHTGAGKTPCSRCGRQYRKDFLPKHERACERHYHPRSSPTPPPQARVPSLVSQYQWAKFEHVDPESSQGEKNYLRPISLVRSALDCAPPNIAELDLSQGQVLFHAIQAAVATGDLQRVKGLLSAYPPPCDTIRGLAYWYWQFAFNDCGPRPIRPDPLKDLRTCAARYGQVDIIKFFVESGLQLDRTYFDDVTPLQCAAEYGHNSTIKYLLKHSTKCAESLREYMDTLNHAIRAGRKSTVELLIRSHSQTFDWDDDGFHSLRLAIESGNLDIVRLLVEHAGMPQSRRSSPLDMAAKLDKPRIIDFSLDSGANIDDISESWCAGTPLSSAAASGWPRAARKLIERGASVDGIDGNFGITPLMYACFTCPGSAQSTVDLLLRHGANVNVCRPRNRSDEEARTALTEACWYQSTIEIVEILLRHGADVNLGSPSPLENALKGMQGVATVRLLLEAGANVNLVSRSCIDTLRRTVNGSLGRLPQYYNEPEEKLQLLEKHLLVDPDTDSEES